MRGAHHSWLCGNPARIVMGKNRSMVVVAIMDDVLSLGGDREPAKWARRVTMVVTAAVLAVAVARSLPQHSRTVAHHSATAATAGPVQLAGLGSGAARLLDESARAHRVALARREHVRNGLAPEP